MAVAFLVIGAPGAHAAGATPAHQFASDANAARAAAGLPDYAYADDLASVALGQAQRMAAAGRIYHNPNLSTEVTGWRNAGENVGVGNDVEQIHQAFMASPSHRDNILSSIYTQIGVGTAVGGDGRLYVSEVFRLPAQQSQPVADPEPAPDPAPEPVSDPAPADPTPPPPAPAPAAVAPAPAPAPVPTSVPVAPAAAVHTSPLPTGWHPHLVASVTPVTTIEHHMPGVMWIAALLAQAVLIAHMLAFWRRYKMGSGW